MNLPKQKGLPINLLSACFNNTVATYKFYWFLSIIQSIENGQTRILKRNLFARMISNAWFTVNYFKVSFGKQDLIGQVTNNLKTIEKIDIDEKFENIFSRLRLSSNRETERFLLHFDKNVPHWFLSPWFPKSSNETDSTREKRIYKESKIFAEKSIYGLYEKEIEVNPEWIEYLTVNARMLKDFCYWNLALYLQAKNPNVPDIPNKLIKPAVRGSLSKQRNFWDVVFDELGTIKCIYTGKELVRENYAVEHFIPYNFVSHDLIWNLIPADRSFNSTKSDKLPSIDKYFNPFFDLQKTAIQILKDKNPKNKLLEDYLTIFSDLNEIQELPLAFTKEKFKERILPLITIASNNGFEFLL